jgi:hypothetical protein
MSRGSTVQRFSGEYGRLEDLFRFDERRSSVPIDEPSRYRWLARALGATVVATLAALLAFRLAGYVPPILLVAVVCAGGVAIRMIVQSVRERQWRRVGDLVQEVSGTRLIGPGGWLERDDGMYEATRRWVRRLEWGAASAQRYTHTVVPHLTELADMWLMQRYGLTRSGDPAQARARLGEAVWAVLYPAGSKAPSAEQLLTALGHLESVPRDEGGIGG